MTDSITICPLTTDIGLSAEFRIAVEPTDRNGLDARSAVMADKIDTVKRSRLGRRIGRMDAGDMELVEAAVVVFLGLSNFDLQ